MSGLSKEEPLDVQSLLLRVRHTRFLSEGSHHVNDLQAAAGERDGVGRRGHRQLEGQRGGDGAREHGVERVDPDGCGLQESKTHQSAQLTQNQRQPGKQEVSE